jgi:H/ACA ribonucleoprotein complex subunit 3
VTRSILQWCRSCVEPTLKTQCPRCGAVTINPLPPRFSPEDAYGKYRRMAKKQARKAAA